MAWPAGRVCRRPFTHTAAPEAPIGRRSSPSPTSRHSAAASGRRPRNPSGPRSTGRSPNGADRTLPPTVASASRTTTSGLPGPGPATPPVSSQAAASPATPPPTTTTVGRGRRPPDGPTGGRVSASAARSTTSASRSKNPASSFKEAVRAKATPAASATPRASTSRSNSTSRWSATKPMGQTTTAPVPSAGNSRMTAKMSGPSHGSGVRPALCQATCQRTPPSLGPASPSPARSATARADDASCSGYGSPAATTRSGREWAVNTTSRSPPARSSAAQSPAAGGSDDRAASTRPAIRSANPGASYHCGTGMNGSPGASRSRAAAARSRYSPEPIDDRCGVSTRPTTRSTPSATRSATASSMNGAVCLAPYRTANAPGRAVSSRAATPATCAAVRAASGDVPPMASYRRRRSASCSGVGGRPRRMRV